MDVQGECTAPASVPVLNAIRQTAERRFHTGGLLYVELGGEPIIDWAFGHDYEGESESRGTVIPWNCAAKISLVIATAQLVQQGTLHFDDPVRTFVPELTDSCSTITVRHLLTHTSGLKDDRTDALEDGAPWDEVLLEVCRTPVEPGSVGNQAAYNRQTNWFLLAVAIARASGLDPQEADQRLGLDDLALASVDLAPPGRPYLPGRSTAGTLPDLVRLCEALSPARSNRGGLDAGIRQEVVTPARIGMIDLNLGTDVTWGLGVPVDGRLFGTKVAANTFGHLGRPGTFVLYEPSTHLAIAARFSNVRREMIATALRSLVVDSIVEAACID